LLTPNPITREVLPDSTTLARLTFVVDGDDVIFEVGTLRVDINVIDSPQCDFDEADTGCLSVEKCRPISADLAICETAGSVPTGGACTNGSECALGSCWFSGGSGSCQDDCLPSAGSGDPGSCPSGYFCSDVSDINGPTGWGTCSPL
jgi:hypothetical protein